MCGTKKLFGIFAALPILLLLVLFPVSNAQAQNQAVTTAGDILQIALPALAVGSTFVAGGENGSLWDHEGTKEAALSIGTTLGITWAGKEVVRKTRPDGSDQQSFPSGHTSAAFSGAAFPGTRYGWQWGVPAYAAAAFVGYSRVQANQHFVDDVVAGASIALLSNWAFVHPMNDRVALLPVAMEKGAGVVVTHPESRIRGREFEQDGGIFDGYYISGPTAQVAVEKGFHSGRGSSPAWKGSSPCPGPACP